MLIGMQLLVDGIEDDRRHRVLPHQSTARLTTPSRPCSTAWANVSERTFRSRNTSRPKRMISASRVPSPETGLRYFTTSMIAGLEAFSEGGRFVRRPLELVVELAGRHEDGQFRQPTIQGGLIAQMLIDRADQRAQLCGLCSRSPPGPRKPTQGPALGTDERVVQSRPLLVHAVACDEAKTGRESGAISSGSVHEVMRTL